jgi:microcystin-dependent protein
MLTGKYAPQGWALCDGKLRNISDNDLLFQLIGTRYGGDGQTTYALPNLQPYQSVPFFISLYGTFPAPT